MMFEKALITGATSGIGEALAFLLAENNIPLLLTGRNAHRLEELANGLSQKVAVVAVTAQLADRKERQKIVDLIRSHRPTLIINNAGFGTYGSAAEVSSDTQLEMVEVNVAAVLEFTLAGVKVLKQAGKKGVILNVSSVSGELPMPGMATYGASKAFVTSFSRALQTELSSEGIHILVSCPGQVATDFANRAAKRTLSKRTGGVMSVAFAASEIWKQIIQRKEYVVFNRRYRFFLLLTKLFPLFLVKKMIWKNIRQRI